MSIRQVVLTKLVPLRMFVSVPGRCGVRRREARAASAEAKARAKSGFARARSFVRLAALSDCLFSPSFELMRS